MSSNGEKNDKPVHLRLFDFSEEEVKAFNYYEILGLEEPVRATPYTIKQAYRKASIRYHPDKTGRDESDYVFIAVKNAWDTLSDVAKRQAYDSTEMPFDDAIPPDVAAAAATGVNGTINGLLYTDDDFFDTFGPVFERNLRFDTRLQQQTKKGTGEIPSLGDTETPIEKVQAFYDYWTRFESWRDFSQKAQEDLFENNNPLEDAESRYEKRFYQKEIDKRAKTLKRQEIRRIQTLVQRAMDADPRLQKYYKDHKEAKEKAALERKLKKEQEEEQKRIEEEERQKEEAEREEREKEQRAKDKAQREKEKKQLRKAKQQLRKVTVATYQEQTEEQQHSIFSSLEEMSDEVEFLCGELNLMQIQELTDAFTNSKDFTEIHKSCQERRQVKDQEKEEEAKAMAELKQKLEEEERKKAAELAERKAWSQLELNALAKAIRKFPGGGGSRWEQIASFINSMCRPDEPRTREECIEKFNQISKATAAAAETAFSDAAAEEKATTPITNGISKKNSRGSATNAAATTNGDDTNDTANKVNGNTSSTAANGDKPETTATSSGPATAPTPAPAPAESEEWSEEQDKQLQDALATFPATMDKNERWGSIAKAVDGKTKKQCVGRFKAIRDAIKNKK